MNYTPKQLKAIASLRQALNKCKKLKLNIIGIDSDLAIFRSDRHNELLQIYNMDQYKAVDHHVNIDECVMISSSAFIDSMGF